MSVKYDGRSFFECAHEPYYIFAADYRHSSAGIRCLHYLCHALNELGEDAYLVGCSTTSPYLHVRLLDDETRQRHYLAGRTPIAVYPEVVSGNPLKLPVVTRWLLNYPGHLGGDIQVATEELVFTYADWCVPEGLTANLLTLPTLDTRLFNAIGTDDRRRHQRCYYANKYLAFGHTVLDAHRDFVSLCHDIPRSPEEIAAILRNSQALHCYEQSALIHEALVCGCPVVLTTSDYFPIRRNAGEVLLLHLDSTLADACGHDTLGHNVELRSDRPRFSGASAWFSGASHITVATSPSLYFGVGDFTIEGWFCFADAAAANTQGLIGNDFHGWGRNAWILGKHDSLEGRVGFFVGGFDGPLLADPELPPVARWTHYAVTRHHAQFLLFRDGVMVASARYAGPINITPTGLVIGSNSDCRDTCGFVGWMNDLRVTKTSLYGGDFEPPQYPFPNPLNTIIDAPGAALLDEPGVCLEGDKTGFEFAQASVQFFGWSLDERQRHAWEHVERFIGTTQVKASTFRTTRVHTIGDPVWSIPVSQRDKYKSVFSEVYPNRQHGNSPSASSVFQGIAPNQNQLEFPGLSTSDLALFNKRVREWSFQPVFHLVIVESRGSDASLARTLHSLTRQHYGQVVATVIAAIPAPAGVSTGRLVWVHCPGNPWLEVSKILSESPADWCGVIRTGDVLAPHALLLVGEFLSSHPDCSVIYSDEDVIDDDGRYRTPRLIADFDFIHLCATGYVGGLLLAKRQLWQTAGGWHPLPWGIDELDAALRLMDTCKDRQIGHVPGILFHRSCHDLSLQPQSSATLEIKRRVIEECLIRRGIPATVDDGLLPGLIRVRHYLASHPKISVLIATQNHAIQLQACLTTLVEITDYPDFEILIIDHGTEEPTAQAYLNGLRQLGDERIRVLSTATGTSLAAALNISAHEARGELLLLLHDDVTILHRDWLFNLASLAMQPGTGAVGGRLLKPDGTLQQGWLIPYKAGLTEPPFQGWPLDAPDSQIALNAEQEVSAVGSACMLVRKDLFLSLGGLDAEGFPDTFADIDFCLTLRQAGHRILWTPYATLAHDSDGSLAGGKDDNNKLLAKWGKALVRDRCVNPYVSIVSSDYRLETDPAFLRDVITWHPVPNIYGMSSDMEGAGHYRVIQPVQGATASCLARGRIARGYPVPVILEKLDIDVIYSQRQVEDQQLKNLARYRKLLNCRIVMDFDDLVTKVPEKSIHKKTVHKDMKSRLRQLGEIAHRFTVSTEPLAQEFRQYHDDVRIIPNALLRPLWENLKSARGTSAKPRVGWAGGVSHQGDLEIIRDVVRETANEVDWIFMGMWLKELAPYIKEVHDGVKFADYPAKLASLNLDLAVAPLEINHFNECKSHLRILEYGILGLPVIATDIHPYRGDFPITLIKNNKHQEWIKALRNHINDLDETRRRGDALREHVLNHWMLDQHLDAWLKAWTE